MKLQTYWILQTGKGLLICSFNRDLLSYDPSTEIDPGTTKMNSTVSAFENSWWGSESASAWKLCG